ncbi:MAG: hypothetical protein J6Z14_00465 [Prevotella sp.]|nr:hypothetical protein [Prevotella sp.]
MKKTYKNPETIVVKVQMAQMVAASDPNGFKGTLGGDSDGGDGGNALGRKSSSLWDDEEEDNL